MSLQGALNFISSGGNIGNKVSKVNIWGPNITNAVNMFNVNSASITDFFAYVPNATDVSGMMNSRALNVVDIDCGVAPFVAGLVLGNVGANAMTMLNLVSNYGYTKGHQLGLRYAHTKLHDFTFFTNAPLASSGVGSSNSLFVNMYWNSLRNLTVIIPNAINAYVFPSNLAIVSASGNFISLQRINIVANSAIRINANTTYNCGASNVKNQSKIVEGYFPNIIDAPGLFAGQRGVNNIYAYGIDYTKLQNAASMFSSTNVDNVFDVVFGSPETPGTFGGMFSYCSNIKEVRNVTVYGAGGMFTSCNNIKTIDGLTIYSNANIASPWGNCNSLKSINNVRLYANGEIPQNAFQYTPNLESITNCEFFGTIKSFWSNANKTKVHTLKNINLGVPGTTTVSATGSGFMNSNTLTTVENIYVNFPNNTRALIPKNIFSNCTNLTSPSTTMFFDVGAGAYLDTHNAPPPLWLTGFADTDVFSGCTNMPDYDLIHANWK